MNEIINRVEKKYLLEQKTYKKLITKLSNFVEPDQFYESTICNVYFDNENNDLIINSINKPLYKSKIRLRSYNVPKLDDYVYLEIKNKYKKLSNKRRIKLTLNEYCDYLNNHKYKNNQIMKEIDYLINYYKLKPTIFIAYDRKSYKSKEDKYFRITFDFNLRSRRDNINLENGSDGEKYFDDDKVIMEIKSLSSIPLWFTKILSQLNIYPTSFSKYGSIYKKERGILNVR